MSDDVVPRSRYDVVCKEVEALIKLKSDLQDVGMVMMNALERIEEDSCYYNHDDIAGEALAYVKNKLQG